jgi:hypothetical protein
MRDSSLRREGERRQKEQLILYWHPSVSNYRPSRAPKKPVTIHVSPATSIEGESRVETSHGFYVTAVHSRRGRAPIFAFGGDGRGAIFTGESMRRDFFVSLLFLLAMFSSYAPAQKNEVSVVAGGTFSPDTTAITGVSFCFDPHPTCAVTRSPVGIETKAGFEGTYARRILDAHAASLYVELPVLGVPDREVHLPTLLIAARFPPPTEATPLDFSSIFFTPSLKVKLLPAAPIAPFFSAGGGFAHFSSRTLFEGLGANSTLSTSNTTGAFQIGGGVDIKTPLPHLGFRAQVREFWTGQPKFNFGGKLDHHQNLFAGGGVVFHF